MDTDQEQTAPEADDSSEQSGTPAQTVRVPNVSPNAKSGLDHTIIGSNALEGAGDQDDDADPFDHPGDDSMPTGDAEAALAWVQEADDADTARARADAVWRAYADTSSDDPSGDPANADLAGRLRSAVYGEGTAEPNDPVVVPDGLTGEDLDAWISGDAVEGDETANPERHAAYLARIEAAAAAGHTRPGEASDGPAAEGDTLLGTTDAPDQAGTDAGESKDPNATDADES